MLKLGIVGGPFGMRLGVDFFQLCSETGHGLVLSSCLGRIHTKNLSRDSLVA